mmetsp:Transcript_14946/g.22640  ORF Transcript_14946/g.22640 Transcript_14946/m.22640 type:complete len:277 (+) Transcript_14946:488-1318(+)|eukprot:CAMPEP_0203680892 /NCGR_PEP_ID=MMETSP0090-20130426/40992_1 /ASSEMBLY_ACC=CAM_ASM_001088 /TAXON_ID=426623 /ORGANISM="Chaetoceros affinis, Strain CCMP159" /LENGTH=276 /DNA_ID=CAMNT_0050549175 /DNA_START=460 /DNA_END=1290 /DNA_ORIENTATION=-
MKASVHHQAFVGNTNTETNQSQPTSSSANPQGRGSKNTTSHRYISKVTIPYPAYHVHPLSSSVDISTANGQTEGRSSSTTTPKAISNPPISSYSHGKSSRRRIVSGATIRKRYSGGYGGTSSPYRGSSTISEMDSIFMQNRYGLIQSTAIPATMKTTKGKQKRSCSPSQKMSHSGTNESDSSSSVPSTHTASIEETQPLIPQRSTLTQQHVQLGGQTWIPEEERYFKVNNSRVNRNSDGREQSSPSPKEAPTTTSAVAGTTPTAATSTSDDMPTNR